MLLKSSYRVTSWFHCHFDTVIEVAWNRASSTTFRMDLKILDRLKSSYDGCFIILCW